MRRLGVVSLVFGGIGVLLFLGMGPVPGVNAKPWIRYGLPMAVTFIGFGVGLVGALASKAGSVAGVFVNAGAGAFIFVLMLVHHPGLVASPGEGCCLGEVRAVISAQQAYKGVTGVYAESLTCLAAPSTCIPTYPETAPSFLDERTASLSMRLGRHFSFHPGRPTSSLPPGVASGVETWAFVAIPSDTVRQKWPRSSYGSCGDDTGRICLTSLGTMPEIAGGRCVITEVPPRGLSRWDRSMIWWGLKEPPEREACVLLAGTGSRRTPQ
jgi:hypothetical protein